MQQLNLRGQTKTEQAIEFLREHEPPEGYMGCFSGGKDSEVIEHLAKLAGVKVEWYYSLMPDPPELIQFIRKHYSHVKILRPKFSYWEGVSKIYPPHFHGRWCCDKIKESPSRAIPLKHRILGIRAEESSGRAKQGWINQFTKKRINYHPIYDWLEWEVWEFIEHHNLPYCKLYDEGFSRLGCIVCPMRAKTKELELWKKRFPAHFKLFEKQAYKWWERIGFHRQSIRGYTKLFDEFLDNWYRGK